MFVFFPACFSSIVLYVIFMVLLWFIIVALPVLSFVLFLIKEIRTLDIRNILILISPPCHVLVVKCILVASPGFVKDQFITYLYREAVRQDNKVLLENRPKFMLVHSSSGHKYSLKGRSWRVMRLKQSNLITGWKLTEMFVLQKSYLIPLWQAGFLTPRWICIYAVLVCIA